MTRLPTRNRSSVNWYIEVGSRRLVEGEWWRLVRRDELERFKAEDWHEIKRHAVDLLLAEAALVVEGKLARPGAASSADASCRLAIVRAGGRQ